MYRALKYRRLRWTAVAAVCAVCGVLLCCFLRPSDEVVQLSSPLLKAEEPIPTQRLAEVEQLMVCGRQQMSTIQEHEVHAETAHDFYVGETVHGEIDDRDLELLAQCTNLRVLVLDYQQISDLSPLAQLPIEYLSLTENEVSDGFGPESGAGDGGTG